MPQNPLEICIGDRASVFSGNALHHFFGSGAPGPPCNSCRSRSNSQNHDNARLGFFECHICLLPRNGKGQPNTGQKGKSPVGFQLAPTNISGSYRLCCSNASPSLKAPLVEEFFTEKKPTFLVLHQPSYLTVNNVPSQMPEIGQRFWRVTSIIEPVSSTPARNLCTPAHHQKQDNGRKEPWDDVLYRVAHWLVTDKLNATVLVLGGSRLSQKTLARYPLENTNTSKGDNESCWRPCVAQRVCAQVFAVGRLHNNPCKSW